MMGKKDTEMAEAVPVPFGLLAFLFLGPEPSCIYRSYANRKEKREKRKMQIDVPNS
jgi:hypothetical protein